MLRQSVSLLFVLPLNDVSLSPLFCRSPCVARSRRPEPKGQRGQSPPSSLLLRPGLFTAFAVDIDETPMGVQTGTVTLTHTLKEKKKTLSSQSYRRGCHGNSLSCLCV